MILRFLGIVVRQIITEVVVIVRHLAAIEVCANFSVELGQRSCCVMEEVEIEVALRSLNDFAIAVLGQTV